MTFKQQKRAAAKWWKHRMEWLKHGRYEPDPRYLAGGEFGRDTEFVQYRGQGVIMITHIGNCPIYGDHTYHHAYVIGRDIQIEI
jgi:hypothetical protein